MYLGEMTLDQALAKAFPNCPAPTQADYRTWLDQYNQIRAEIDRYTVGGTKNNRTTKYGLLRSALFKHLEAKPISACEIKAFKGARKISDAEAIKEMRRGWKVLSKEWKDRATHKERGQIITVVAILAAVVTAGAAAWAAAAGATAGGASVGGAITAGAKAAAASALGIEGGASMSVKQLGMTALKKIAISKGTDFALDYAAKEFAKHNGKKADAAAMKELERELNAANAEYAALTKKGVDPRKAEKTAIASPDGGAIFPLGLVALAAKLLMK